jgi:hypothetical protein
MPWKIQAFMKETCDKGRVNMMPKGMNGGE